MSRTVGHQVHDYSLTPEDGNQKVEVGFNKMDYSNFVHQWASWNYPNHDVDVVLPVVEDDAMADCRGGNIGISD
jgi:hypothetical protein